MTKYSHEQRMETVLKVVDDHMSIKDAAKLLGIAESPIKRWVKRYEQYGTEGVILKHGTYAGEFKERVIEYMHENHLSVNQTAVLFGIPTDTTVSKWERIYYEEGPIAFYRDRRGRKKNMPSYKHEKEKPDKEKEEDLIAEVQRLRMENAYLKKLNALVQKRISQKNGKKQPPSSD